MASLSLRKRLIIILYIISFTISIFIFAYIMGRVSVDVECTSHNQYVVDGGYIYFVQNNRKEGFLFQMNTKGRVYKMYASRGADGGRILSLSLNEGRIYLMQQTFIEQKSTEDEDAIVSIPAYRISCLDDKFNLVSTSPKFVIDDSEILTGFSAEATGLFMTFLTEDGMTAKVYSVDPEVLKDPKEPQGADVSLEGVRSKKCEEGRYYSDALYAHGQLYVRTDKSTPEGIFAIDPMVNDIVSGMKLRAGQILTVYSTYIIWYIAALIIWFIVLYLIIRVLEDRNRSFYYIVIAEAVLFVIVAAATFTVSEEYVRSRKIEHSRFAVTSMIGLMDAAGINEYIDYNDDAFYDSTRYRQIAASLGEFVKRPGNSDIFYDVLVVRLRDNLVCASASGRNKQVVTDVYGSDMESIATQIARGERYVGVDMKIQGQDYRAVAVADAAVSADYAIVGIINVITTDASVFVDNLGVFILFLVVFAVASALVVLVWFLHMRDLTVLEQALSDTALGKELPQRPAVLGRDVKDMWDSLVEINKRVEEIQYSKVRILEAYYRFAPKNVEKVLGKNSIVEVTTGDSKIVAGTICTFSINLSGGKKLKRLDNLVGSIGEYQKNHESVIIGKAPDMSALQILFSENEYDSTSTFIEMFGRSNKSGSDLEFSVLLDYDTCVFGVTGNEDETSTYMYTENRETIRAMSAFTISVGLGLVISQKVYDREKISGKVRFIGYGGVDKNGELIGLYEILDACSARIRNERLATLSKFEEALDLYYEKDFYLARTKFSDILKETPSDKLARWYVFESDRYLNENAEGENYKILHI
jgi:hypothetical protein